MIDISGVLCTLHSPELLRGLFMATYVGCISMLMISVDFAGGCCSTYIACSLSTSTDPFSG